MSNKIYHSMYLFFLLIVLGGGYIHGNHPTPVDGMVDLSGWEFEDQGSYALSGDWKWVYGCDDLVFASPDYNDSWWETYSIPRYWNERTGTHTGIAWFRLTILTGRQEDLGLYIHHSNTSYELYVNGKKMMYNGKPGSDKKNTIPQFGEKTAALPAASSLTLAWRIANYHDPFGGPGLSPVIGKLEALDRDIQKKQFYNSLLIGLILMIGFYRFIFWIVRRDDLASLALSLCAFSLFLREIATQGILEQFFQDLPLYFLHWKLEAVSTTLVVLMFVWFCYIMYSFVFPRKLFYFMIIGMSSIILYLVALPIFIFLKSLIYIEFAMPVAFLICIIVLIRAITRGKKDAVISLAGIFLLFFCITLELLLIVKKEFITGITGVDMNFTTPGFVLFMFCQAILLAVHFSRAYKRASYLGKNLAHEVQRKTEQLEIQKKELETSNMTLKKLNRQKNLFYQNVTHELRTPLTLILGPLESMIRGFYGPLKKGIKNQLYLIRRNGGRLLNYINQLLELSKLESGKADLVIESMDIRNLIKLVAANFESSFKTKEIQFHVQVPDQECLFRGDKDKIEKIISNLLSNALKFTPRGGRVWMYLNSDHHKHTFTIIVKDTGCGIPARFLPSLFKRFKQADNNHAGERNGSGLGLALVKEYTELHGGSISVTTKEDEGSEFRITLPGGDLLEQDDKNENLRKDIFPVTAGEEENQFPGNGDREKKYLPGSTSPSGKKERVLLVEDNPDMRIYIRGLLKNDYELIEAADGGTGLKRAKAVCPDLIITDLMMPYMDGEEMIRMIKKEKELTHIPVIVLTAKLIDNPESNEIFVLADDLLSKPFHPRELLSCVRNLCELKTRREKLAYFDKQFLKTPEKHTQFRTNHQGNYPYHPVLIVDDNEETLKTYQELLVQDGITNSITCADSRQVMPILLEQKVSLVILDVKMPYIDGEELLIRIKKEFPLVEVLIVTGIDNIETAVSCIKAGAFNYCVKPVEIHFLLSEINHILKISTLENELQRAGSDVHPGNLKNPGAFSSIMTVSERMNHVFHRVEAIASSSQPLLVTGETGTGKDFIPGILHSISGRNGKLVKVTVSGLDDTMFSDTLFGHTKGAYTGASETRKGLIEQAKDGTLFLDEIGDMPPGSQVKLLHLIQHGEYYKLGSDTLCHSNTRIVAATNADLKEKIARGLFREDLYYRLTYQIHLPPLRDRLHDLPVLTGYFMETAAQDLGKNVPAIPGQLIPLLRTYHFPGNVRELKRMIYEAVSCHTKGKLSITYFKKYIHDHTPHDTQHRREEQQAMDFTLSFPGSFPTLQEVNAKIITHAMEKSSGNQVLAAYLLGMTPSALNKRLKKMYGDDFCHKFKKKTQDFAWNRDNKGESQKGMKRLP